MKHYSKLLRRLNRNKKTDMLSETYTLHHKMISKPLDDVQSLDIPEHGKISLLIGGVAERVDFTETPTLTLGRFDPTRTTDAIFDLTDYGAVERGVSRLHCKLEVKDNQIIVTDLNSTNGTYIAGNRVKPDHPTIMKKGEELVLGRLAIQLMVDRS